jgi:E3 ubiquitin-protein ligase UBR4
VPFSLQLLTALAQGHAATAAALAADQPSLLPLLHLLEGTAGGSTITPLAEACLEALAGAGADGVASSIAALRGATAAEMRARAAKKRQALLASMGMVQIEAAAEAGGGVRILPSPGGVPALSPLAAELAALEGSAEDDEGGNVCMVCREGYALQPATLLGCYCFCRVAAAAEWPGCAPPWGTPHNLLLSTVSHFNLIHISCHAAAKAADASLRQPKREWQGATLRNGNVLCNSLLPLTSPAGGAAESAYAAAVTSFWQQQLSAPSSREAAAAAGSSGGGGGSNGGSDAAAVQVGVSLSRRSAALREADCSLLRVSLVAADMAMLLWRFGAQLSFSEEARGGGRASNARLLFALLQLGRYYVVEAPATDLKQAQALLAAAGGAGAALGLETAAATAAAAAAVGGAAGSKSGPGSTAGTAASGCTASELSELVSHAPFVLALSLLAMGPADWMSARRSLLAVAARAGVARKLQLAAAAADNGSSHRRSSSGASPAAAAAAGSAALAVGCMSDVALYDAAAPMLRLFGFVDWLHQWAQPAVGLAPAGSCGGSGSRGWGGAMAQQLQDLKGCADAAGELLGVVDEAERALGLQDLLDGLGLLGVVLGPKCSSCEEFLRQAVAGL